MAAFSRGCSLPCSMPSLRRALIPSLRSSPLPRALLPSRCFSNPSSLRLASKRLPPAKPKHNTSRPTPTFNRPALPRAPPPSQPFQNPITTLALSPTPTLLYTAPPHTLFVVGSYFFGTFCISYAAYNFHAHYLHPPPDLAFWVPVAFGMICFGMSCLGTWLLLGPARWVIPLYNLLPFQSDSSRSGPFCSVSNSANHHSD